MDLIAERPSIFPSKLVERLMLSGTIVVMLCYAWLTATTLEPKFEAPKSVASELAWIVNGEPLEWSEVQYTKPVSSAKIDAALTNLAQVLPVIGGFRKAPEILIDSDHSDRYTIGDDRIQISEEIATADGQLAKALLKVWLLQRGGPEYTASLLRIEVVSDLLTAMLTRSEVFGLPGTRGSLSIPASPDGWIGFAKSFETSCESPWRSLELTGACGTSQELSALSFRPLLDGMIWDTYQNIPAFQRYEFLRTWAKALRTQSSGIVAVRRDQPKTLVEWRDWLDHELLLLVPMPSVRAAIENASARAGLRKAVSVSLIIHRTGPDVVLENLQSALPGRVRDSFIVSLEESATMNEQWLVTGRAFGHPASWIRITENDLAKAETPLFVLQSCQPATLSELIDFPVQSERLLYVQACSGHPSTGWKSLLIDGLKGFARAEPDMAFLQLQRSQIAFALERGQLDRNESLQSYMTKTAPGERPLLGLGNAEWRRDMLAYRVIGAIEAVEWFRSPSSRSL